MSELLAGPLANIDFSMSIKAMLTLIAMSTLRVYALCMVFPPMQDGVLNGPIRNGVCLTIGVFIAWGQPMYAFEHMEALTMALLTIREIVIGLLLGVCAAVPFWVASAVGALVDNMAGFNSVQQSNPLSGEQSTPISDLLGQLACSLFWMLGGSLMLVGVLLMSFRWWPLARMAFSWSTMLEDFAAVYLQRFAQQTFVIAAPILLVLLLMELGIGMLSKTAEKLEPSILTQPLKGSISLIMLALLVAVYFQEARPELALTHLADEIRAWVSVMSAPR